jgi:dolichol kinase
VNGAMKVAWGLTAFVILAGIVGWIATGRAVFAVFLVLGVLTAIGAFMTGRNTPAPPSEEGTP